MNFSFIPTRKRSANAGRNAIFTLTFYRQDGQWVFDDDRRDIYVEPLVCGADDVFDVLSGRDQDPAINRCTVNFSEMLKLFAHDKCTTCLQSKLRHTSPSA